ncbi:hypothetical protein SDC9_79753 [bioreactor metagenome]|uniref:Uncharacterized protein n=1 Tax=bioreactor metagenome TaxID=1076179 RepID=A0A644Z507_9ZZZZ
MLQAGELCFCQPFALWAEQINSAVAVQNGNAAVLLAKGSAHIFRKGRVTFKLIRPKAENIIVKLNKLAPVRLSDRIQMANHPAVGLKLPLIGKANEAVVAAHVGEERELAAA